MSNAFKDNAVVALDILGVFDDDEDVEASNLTPTARIDLERSSTDTFLRTGALKTSKMRNHAGGLMLYDPYFYNTAITTSSIARPDKHTSKLYFRGYDMESLVESSDFLSVAHLLIYGGPLPTGTRASEWQTQVLTHTYLHEDILAQLRTFRYDAHPMGMFISSIAALSTFHPEANPSLAGASLYAGAAGESARNKQLFRILGKSITVAACAYRTRIGRPFNPPPSGLGYAATFLCMLDRLGESSYTPSASLASLLDKLFIALADDGLNCASGLLRHVASTRVDPYSAVSAGLAAHYGVRISGVGSRVISQLESIGSPAGARAFVERTKRTGGRIQGFGHLNYKCYDPRCRVVKRIAHAVAGLLREAGKGDARGENLLATACMLEDVVLSDEYYRARRVFPNVDLYLGVAVELFGFPADFFPVVTAIPRVAGLVAHWREATLEEGGRIARPRQLYAGEGRREYVPMEEREALENPPELSAPRSTLNRRRALAKAENEKEKK